jgi:hypothetical protein
VYQRHAYLEEMREAIELWEKHLSGLPKRKLPKRTISNAISPPDIL